MKVVLSNSIISLMKKQGFVMVSSLDSKGKIHCSAKGIAGIDPKKVFLIDLYKARTYTNLSNNPIVTISFVDEHRFAGYALQGKAKIVEKEKIKESLIAEWEDKVLQRISQRVVRNLHQGKKGEHHPEASFPHPKYLIEIDIEKIIDLAPAVKK
ncbi:MAG: pyridoxamine 5'-phosphate oxidase family protein [Candidatus Omnitrophica bacterium]|nr:pyridoxamine 5'-phosphate oxidase family protein [Candidatus Omnitrophota bacterium]